MELYKARALSAIVVRINELEHSIFHYEGLIRTDTDVDESKQILIKQKTNLAKLKAKVGTY